MVTRRPTLPGVYVLPARSTNGNIFTSASVAIYTPSRAISEPAAGRRPIRAGPARTARSDAMQRVAVPAERLKTSARYPISARFSSVIKRGSDLALYPAGVVVLNP